MIGLGQVCGVSGLCKLCLSMVQDAETRLEDQISKLLLEKQELEWEKVQLGLAGSTSTFCKK